MDNGKFQFFKWRLYLFLEADFVAFISSASSLVEECAGNFGTGKVRKSLTKLSTYLGNLSELSEPSILTFCTVIPSWYRLLSGYPKHRKLVMKV